MGIPPMGNNNWLQTVSPIKIVKILNVQYLKVSALKPYIHVDLTQYSGVEVIVSYQAEIEKDIVKDITHVIYADVSTTGQTIDVRTTSYSNYEQQTATVCDEYIVKLFNILVYISHTSTKHLDSSNIKDQTKPNQTSMKTKSMASISKICINLTSLTALRE